MPAWGRLGVAEAAPLILTDDQFALTATRTTELNLDDGRRSATKVHASRSISLVTLRRRRRMGDGGN